MKGPRSKLAASAVATRAILLLLFFLSGVAALIYQIVWTKQLALVFGVTVYATSAVVSAYMAGLALGSVFFGWWVDRWKRPLVLFAFLEGGIAVMALLLPVITSAVLKPAYVAMYGSFGDSHYLMSLFRFTVTFLVLLLPTSLMGGTLPVISRAYVSQLGQLGGGVAGLYSANNFGAFLGCVAAGFLFLELLGGHRSVGLAALLNVLVALVALLLAGRPVPGVGERASPDVAQETSGGQAQGLTRPVKVALWVFGLEGFTSLVYQIAWIRLLVFFVATNIYGMTSIVATYLVGLSLGALVVRPIVSRVRNLYRLLGIIEMGVGLSALLTIPLLPRMVGLLDSARQTMSGWWGGLGSNVALFTVTFIVILVPTCFMGATLPVVSRIYVQDLRRIGRKMGVIGCLDTVGSILGAFAGGFVMIPLLGIQRTIIATAIMNVLLAMWVFAEDPLSRTRLLRRAGFVTSIVALAVVPLMLLLKPVPLILFSEPAQHKGDVQLIHYSEDAESSVSVLREHGFTHRLYINASQAAATTRRDRPSHELIAHVPLLLHPKPARALLLGFGIGFTSWACRVHDVEVDVVELSPGVRAANERFRGENNNILADTAVHLRIDDGRNYVLGTQQKYDMIQAGIIHPRLSSGNASFYSADFYRDCKRLLKPGGIVSQWLPTHGMSHEQFKMLIRTFQDVFPHTSVWFKNSNEYCALVGTERPLKIDFQDFERRVDVPRVREHLARCDVQDAYDLLDSFCVADEALREAIGDGVVDTDDRPYIEFQDDVPNVMLEVGKNVRLLGEARQRVWDRLTNIPPDRQDEVGRELRRWFMGTEYLLRGYYYGQGMRAVGQQVIDTYHSGRAAGRVLDDRLFASPDSRYARVFADTRDAFEMARRVNPDDKIAEFEWKYRQIENERLLADVKTASGRMDEALVHLKNASGLLPQTEIGAYATLLYNAASSRAGELP